MWQPNRGNDVITPDGALRGLGATRQLGRGRQRHSGAVFKRRGRLWSTLSVSIARWSTTAGGQQAELPRPRCLRSNAKPPKASNPTVPGSGTSATRNPMRKFSLGGL